MRYLHMQWIHSHPDEPVDIYSEITDDGWESRKIEIFPDGSVGFADSAEATGSTMLSLEPLPTLEEIAADPQFVPAEINKVEFEKVWENRCRSSLAGRQ
jgi:hypothetical protein